MPTIPAGTLAVGHAPAHEAIDQLYRGVMVDLEPLRQRTDGGAPTALPALDLKEGQVLLWLDAGLTRRHFPDALEPSKLIPEIGEGRIIERVPTDVASGGARGVRDGHGSLYITA